MRKFLFAALGLFGLGVASVAQAAPALSFRVYDDNTLVSGLSTSSSTGSLAAGGTTPHFNVTANAAGTPLIPAPSLLAQTTIISAGDNFSGTHTIRVEFTQTGLDSATAGGLLAQFASTFTANFLVNGQDVTSVTLSSYVDNGNAAFGRGTLLATQAYTSGPTNASPELFANVPLTNALFSETVVITATFTNSFAGLNTNAQIIRVPEPASLAILGSALLGLGLVRRRKG